MRVGISAYRITTTIIAPTPLVAANFVILGRIIGILGTQYSRLGPTLCMSSPVGFISSNASPFISSTTLCPTVNIQRVPQSESASLLQSLRTVIPILPLLFAIRIHRTHAHTSILTFTQLRPTLCNRHHRILCMRTFPSLAVIPFSLSLSHTRRVFYFLFGNH